MRFSLSMKTVLAILGLVFLGCATTGSQRPPEGAKLVELKIPEPGTEAEWKVVKNGEESIQSGVSTKEEIDGVLSFYWKNPEGEDTFIYELESMNVLGMWSHKNKEWLRRFKPNNGNKQYPLWAGKKYRASYNFSRKNGWSGQVTSWVNIEDWETVTVPAGTFETLKIVQGNKNYSYTHWFAPELGMGVKFKVTSKEGNRSGELLKVVKP